MKNHKLFSFLTLCSIFIFTSCANDSNNQTISTKKPDISSNTSKTKPTNNNITPTEYKYEKTVWSDDYTKATIIFKNNIDELNIDATIEKKIIDPTCEKDGSITYTAYTIYNNQTYLFNKEIILPKLNHKYKFDSFIWDDYYPMAKLICENDNTHIKYEIPEITETTTKNATCEDNGTIEIKATYEGHTETKTVGVAALNHKYKFDSFIWNDDEHTAKAKYVCENDNNHIIYYDANMQSNITSSPTCESEGSVTYTAYYGDYVDTKTYVLEALNHNYKFNRFKWTGYEAKAILICENDVNHVQEVDATVTSEVTLEPTYTATGIRTYTATYEGNSGSITEVIPTLEYFDTFVGVRWDDDKAYAVYVNKIETENEKLIDIEDVEEKIIKNPTCTEDGSMKYVVTYEGKEYESEEHIIDALDHIYEFDSFIWYEENEEIKCKAKLICSRNLEHITYEELEVYINKTDETCDDDGSILYEVYYYDYYDYKEITIPKSGHNYQFDSFEWSDDYKSAKAVYICQNDNSHVIKYDAIVTSEVTTEATTTDTGIRTYTATYDGHTDTKEEIIPILS